MSNLSKYRIYSYMAMVALVVSFLLSLAALWDTLFNSEVKHEGWLIVFLLLSFLIGVFIFFIAFKTTDVVELEKIRREAFESGKTEILLEMEKRNQEEKSVNKIEEEDIGKITETILSGLQGIRTETGFYTKILGNLAKKLELVQGIMYVKEGKGELFNPIGKYALTARKPQPFVCGESLPGQAAANKSLMIVYDIPEDYFIVSSGLGSAKPRYLLLVPVLYNEESVAVLELAAFKKPDEIVSKVLNKISFELGIKMHKFITAS